MNDSNPHPRRDWANQDLDMQLRVSAYRQDLSTEEGMSDIDEQLIVEHLQALDEALAGGGDITQRLDDSITKIENALADATVAASLADGPWIDLHSQFPWTADLYAGFSFLPPGAGSLGGWLIGLFCRVGDVQDPDVDLWVTGAAISCTKGDDPAVARRTVLAGLDRPLLWGAPRQVRDHLRVSVGIRCANATSKLMVARELSVSDLLLIGEDLAAAKRGECPRFMPLTNPVSPKLDRKKSSRR